MTLGELQTRVNELVAEHGPDVRMMDYDETGRYHFFDAVRLGFLEVCLTAKWGWRAACHDWEHAKPKTKAIVIELFPKPD